MAIELSSDCAIWTEIKRLTNLDFVPKKIFGFI